MIASRLFSALTLLLASHLVVVMSPTVRRCRKRRASARAFTGGNRALVDEHLPHAASCAGQHWYRLARKPNG